MNQSEIKQSFNLKKLLGYSPSDAQKELFYELAVDKMVGRTASGFDRSNKEFPNYTEQYADRKGVSEDSVDLILTGEMLNSFDESVDGDKVIISIDSDQVGKAHGNITGSYGKSSPRKSKARDFFGFKSEEDIEDILSEVDSLRDETPKVIQQQAQAQEQQERINLADLRDAVNMLDIDFGGFDG